MSSPILVLGATSCVGRGIVEAALALGRPVLAVGRDQADLDALAALHPRADLTLVPGDAGDDAAAEALAQRVRGLARPLSAIVVAAFREPVGGRLLEQNAAALRRQLDAEVLPQFSAARALLPLLSTTGRNGTYVVVAGPGGEQPWAGYGQRSVANAATRMLLRVLHDEARALAVRVHLLAVEMPARTELNRERACAQWPSTRAIGDRTLALLEQRDGTRADEAVVRYAWHADPKSDPAPLASRPALPATPPRALADAWARLQPLLSTHHDERQERP